jgi:hypothetical protein
MDNQSMPKEYLIEYRCKAIDCRVSVINADQLTSEEIQTLADREIRRQIAEKTRRSANKINGESTKFFNAAKRETQVSPDLTPVFDVKEHMQPTERETVAKKNAENARLADLMRRFAAGELTQEQMLAEMNNQ